MDMPSNATAFEVLCLQAADEGRGNTLFGGCVPRARSAASPFMLPGKFPSVYLEFPLVGEPFMDVTILYGELKPGMTIASELAGDVGPLMDWYATAHQQHDTISLGFELDTGNGALPKAGLYFQPRDHMDLVMPYCKLLGEPERGELYLDLAQRMPHGWSLAALGMFRGRPNSPLRVGGYLGKHETEACVADVARLPSVFEAAGFTAYDDVMLAQVREFLSTAPVGVDFQLDIYPDGTLGTTFALDLQLGIQQPEAVQKSYEDGLASRVFGLLQELGAADERWKLSAGAAFARALPVKMEDGTTGVYSFILMPQWIKVRWINGVLQPSKLYLYGTAGLMES